MGFVAYHERIAINDFRYMTRSQTLNPDWEDPWYSAFDTRSLRRQYYAPMTGFIYVEPYEVRKEIIVRLKTSALRGSRAGRAQPFGRNPADVRQKIIEFLSQHHPVTIDGEPAGWARARGSWSARCAPAA